MAVSWPALLPVSPWFGTLHPQQHDKWRETCECICQDEFGSVSAATLNRFGYRADDDITDDDIYLHSLGKVLNSITNREYNSATLFVQFMFTYVQSKNPALPNIKQVIQKFASPFVLPLRLQCSWSSRR